VLLNSNKQTKNELVKDGKQKQQKINIEASTENKQKKTTKTLSLNIKDICLLK